MTEERYYATIRQIARADSEAGANELLSEGFELLKIENLAAIDMQTKNAISKIVYILGRMAATQNNTHATQASPKPPITKTPSVPLQLLAALPWKLAAFDPSGKTESVAPDKIPEELKAYLQKTPKFEDSTHVYTYSPKGWLNRKKK